VLPVIVIDGLHGSRRFICGAQQNQAADKDYDPCQQNNFEPSCHGMFALHLSL
jgi:hypothetical protein